MPLDDLALDDEKKTIVFHKNYLLKSPRVYNLLKKLPKEKRVRAFAHTVGYGIIEIDDDYNKYYKVKKGDIVIDAGAHVGIFTRKYSEAVGKDGLVLSFEPDFRLLGILTQNTEDLKNVKIYGCGLWDKDEIKPFHIPSKYWGSSSFTHWHTNTEWSPVRVRALDSIIEEEGIKKVNFIKMDVEGSEMRILKGAEETLKKIDALGIAAYHFMEGSLEERTSAHVVSHLKERNFDIRMGTCSDGDIVYANRSN